MRLPFPLSGQLQILLDAAVIQSIIRLKVLLESEVLLLAYVMSDGATKRLMS